MADEENEENRSNAADGDGADGIDLKKRKRKLIVFIILGILLIGSLGVGAAMFLGQGEQASDNDQIVRTDEPQEEKATPELDKKTQSQNQTQKPASASKEDPSAAVNPGEMVAGDVAPKDEGAKIDFGDTLKMETFHLNLGNALENRYVRLEVTLEYSGGAGQKKEIEKRMPQLRDAIISIVTRKTREFILAPDGKDALRKEILIRMNRYMTTKIDSVYITDILIE